jgi:hypothetical protein
MARLFKRFPVAELEHGGDQKLADAERDAHHPG